MPKRSSSGPPRPTRSCQILRDDSGMTEATLLTYRISSPAWVDSTIFSGRSSVSRALWRPTHRPHRGRDVMVGAEVTLEEAAFGTETVVDYPSLTGCETCGSSGASPGTHPVTCPDCGGGGQVRMAQRSVFGTMMSVTTCPTCQGEGSIVTDPCPDCTGSGARPNRVKVNVEVPAGVSDGTRLRIIGRGESSGRSGQAGDLFVEIAVSPDPRFERRDLDLVHRLIVGVPEATLGARIEVPTIDGVAENLDIPAGTQPGSIFTLSGRGMPQLGRRARGDMHVVVDVVIPEVTSDEEADLVRRWAELRGESANRTESKR